VGLAETLNEEDTLMKARKTLAVTAAVLVGAMGLAACGGGDDSGSGGSSDGKVEMTFWHNSTTGDGKAYWDDTVAAFEEANPNVTIQIQAIQNEDMDGKLQTALNSGDAPDIFMARGGGKLTDIVEAGQVMDLTDKIDPAVKEAIGEGTFSAFTADGKTYGMPIAVLPGGMFYSKDLFTQAGVAETPTTIDELDAAVDQLKTAGIAPIALGAKAAWPAAHWYFFFALRECSQDVMEDAGSLDFSDPCWLKAAEDLQTFADTEPFNDGFLTTSAQQGAGSSAGMIANHQAAMELMGGWNVGQIADLTPTQEPLADLGWFPFPAVDGGKGDPAAFMGGVDGFSCYADAPPECADFLNFIGEKAQQEAYAVAFSTIPANKDALGAVPEGPLTEIASSFSESPYTIIWLDTLLGQNVGNALNKGVVDLLSGVGSPDDIIAGVESAAAKG